MKKRLLIAIRSLDIGGAEKLVMELVKRIDKNQYEVALCTMYKGTMDSDAKEILGENFVCLNKTGRYDFFGFFGSYLKFLKDFHPDTVYAHIGEMNLFSLWAKPFLPNKTKIIWCIHSAFIDYKSYGKVFQAVFWLQKIFSKFVDKIIYVSSSAKDFHDTKGYYSKNSIVIQNGIDTSYFCPDKELRISFRAGLKVAENTKIIGIAARIDKMKGYPLLAQVATRMLSVDDSLLFVAAGDGDDSIKQECIKILGRHSDRFVWLGFIKDLRGFYNGIDIFTLPSYGEAFGLTVAEAMSCGKTAVVSSAGNMKDIVDDKRFIFEIGDKNGLETAIKSALTADSMTNQREKALRFDINATLSNTLRELFDDK